MKICWCERESLRLSTHGIYQPYNLSAVDNAMTQSTESINCIERSSRSDMDRGEMSETGRDRPTISNGKWTSLTGNGRDVSNLVQFVNSASNDIKDAIDKSSPNVSFMDNSERMRAESRRTFISNAEKTSTFTLNVDAAYDVGQRNASRTNPSFTRNVIDQSKDLRSTTVNISRKSSFTPKTETVCGDEQNSARKTENVCLEKRRKSANGPERFSPMYSENYVCDEKRKGSLTTLMHASFTRNGEDICDDRRKRYFNNRDSGSSNPLKVLKVEPLNVVKIKPSSEKKFSDSLKDYNPDKATDETCDEITPNKRAKLSIENSNNDPEPTELPELDDQPADNSSLEIIQLCPDKDETKKVGERKSATVNPLPLRKRRLPASFWQEPGKQKKHQPSTAAESSARQTAFLPIAPRRSPTIGGYVKDFFGSNLSASEKLELLRLNSLERENYNHLCASRDFHNSRCPSYPCVLMHCRNQYDNFRVGGFPGIHPSGDYRLHAPPSVSLAYPNRGGPYVPHHERLPIPNIMGLSYPPVSPYFSDMFRHDDAFDSNYGSRLLPTMDPGSPLFPLSSPLHPSVVRPVPKKHLSNISGSFHPLFDVR